MAIEPICDSCSKKLKDFGALLFSPPDDDSKATKYHFCQSCYDQLVKKFVKKT